MNVCPVCNYTITIVSNRNTDKEYGDCTCGFSYKYNDGIRTVQLGQYSFTEDLTGHTSSNTVIPFVVVFTLFYFYATVTRFLQYE